MPEPWIPLLGSAPRSIEPLPDSVVPAAVESVVVFPLLWRLIVPESLIAPERFSQQSSTRQPVVAAGPDSGISYVLSGVRNADVMFIDQVDAAGTISPFANNQSNVGHELLPMIAASNGHVLWSAFTTDDTLQPDDIYMVATTGGDTGTIRAIR